MSNTNYGALIRSGLVAAVAFVIVEFLLEGAVSLAGFNEAALLREMYPDLQFESVAFQFANVLQLVVLMIFAMWLYSALTPRFGAGPRCALVVSFALWFMYLMFATSFARLGVLPMNIAVASLLFNLIEIPAAVLAGSNVYDATDKWAEGSAKSAINSQ